MKKSQRRKYDDRHAAAIKTAKATKGYDFIEAFVNRGIRIQRGVIDAK